MSKLPTASPPTTVLPKLCGADIELGNFIASGDGLVGTGYEASRALLAEIEGLPIVNGGYLSQRWKTPSLAAAPGAAVRAGVSAVVAALAYDPQDVSRRFLAGNGSCAYIDLDHLEICIPEVLSAFDHVAASHAMLRIVRDALHRANESRRGDRSIKVLINNSDGLGNSYGSHLNFLISRRTFDNLFKRQPHHLQFLASFQVSSILLTGQGKVGSENGQPSTRFQISQRADFFEVLHGVQTTFNRPIVNARDETLCSKPGLDGPSSPARLHVIFFDSAVAHGSSLFRVGPMQLVLTLLELGLINPGLILNDPLAALQAYSHDPTLRADAALISGNRMTALELQSAFLDEVKSHAARGVFDGVVPRAEEIISLWEDTIVKLARRDWTAVARRGIDWVLKLMAIERALEQRPELDWDSAEIKMIDHLYSSLDDDGLYWAYEASRFVEQLAPPERIAHLATSPPSDTRAWTRAMLLRNAARNSVVSVDWNTMTFKVPGRHNWPTYRTLEMANPLGFTQAEAQNIFDNAEGFADLLDGLEALATHHAQSPHNPLPQQTGEHPHALSST